MSSRDDLAAFRTALANMSERSLAEIERVSATGKSDIDRLADVLAERERQDAKWGAGRNLAPEMWLTILTEEVGEVAQEILQDGPGLRAELVQVAAVAVAFIDYLDRSA